MWTLYDELIDKIPENIKVDRLTVGKFRSAVWADGHVGLATTVYNYDGDISPFEIHQEKNLKQLASLVKSWDFSEASLGLAAINSYYNRLDGTGASNKSDAFIKTNSDAFDFYEESITGKKVAVIGHFQSLSEKLKSAAKLSIIEREPKQGDYPDSAAEYLLPKQDFVFITAMTLQNKTLPRLLELSKNAKIILMGPSLVLSDSLFKYGVETLSGFCVTNAKETFEAVENGTNKGFYQWGEKIILKKP